MRWKFFHIVFLVAISAAANAQTLKQWVWDEYKVKFKAPEDLLLKKNDSSIYEAGNSNMYLDIYPRRGEEYTHDGLKNNLIKWASDEGVSYQANNTGGSQQPIYIDNLNGFWGCAIDGSKNSLPTTMLLIVNPSDPTLSFYIWINYTQEYYHDALAVLQSFTPISDSGSPGDRTNQPVKPKKKKTTSTTVPIF
jgi:hypothetical protein